MRRLLVPVFLGAFLLGVWPMTAGAASPGATSPTAKYLCLIVLDAGRPDYITNRLNSLPTIKAFLKHSRWYDRAWVGNLMSITPPDHAVIGTGSFPKDDGGIVNWDWGIHSTGTVSPTFQAVASYQNGYAFKVIKNSGTPTLAGVIHRKYPKGVVIAGSGAHFHAAGPMGGPDANWIFWFNRVHGFWAPQTLGQKPVPGAILNDASLRTKLATSNHSTVPLVYDPLPLGQQDSQVVSAAIRSLQLYRPRAMMLNLPEVDTIGHWSHQWKKDEGILYHAFDRDFARLLAAYKSAGIYNQTLFVVTADHGMIQSKHRVLDRDAVVKQIEGMVGGKKGILLANGGGAAGPTMTSIWLRDPSRNAQVAQAIYAHHYDNVSAVFYNSGAANHYAYKMTGCESCSPSLQQTYYALLNTEAGPTGEDIAILLRENARNSGLPQMMGRHGGADWGSQHITLFLSGPGVKVGTSQHPARLADLAPTIERFMGITPNARDGIVLADAFQHPSAGDVTRQQSADQQNSVYVTALAKRAASDVLLEREGKLANFIPSDEIIIHWKRRLAVTVAGIVVLIGTAVGLAWAIAEVRRQGTGLTWTA